MDYLCGIAIRDNTAPALQDFALARYAARMSATRSETYISDWTPPAPGRPSSGVSQLVAQPSPSADLPPPPPSPASDLPPLDLDQLYQTHLQSSADGSSPALDPRFWSGLFGHVAFLQSHNRAPLSVSPELQDVIFSNPAASTFSMALQKLYSSFRVPSSAIQRPVISIMDTASMAPLTVAERHRIWLRLCQIDCSASYPSRAGCPGPVRCHPAGRA